MLHHPIRSSLIVLIAAIAVAVTAAYLFRPTRALADVGTDCEPCYELCAVIDCEAEGGQEFESDGQTWCLPSCDDATINNQQDFNEWLDDVCDTCPGGDENCEQALYSEWQNQCRGYDENPTPWTGFHRSTFSV